MEQCPPTTACRACGTVFAADGNGIGRLCLGCLLASALTAGEEADSLARTEIAPAPAGESEDPAGRIFAHYEISLAPGGGFAELGRGAMGITYRAVDTILRCDVALKVVNPAIARVPAARARFLREARVAAGLRHQHVASVFFFGERPGDGQLFYAMELVEGETLHARVRRAGGLPVAVVLDIGAQVADALAAAEARGLTHRDLKPANLMLVDGASVNVKVIDFGLAKAAGEPGSGASLTGAGDFVGTPVFASPEHFDVWQDIDARSDFYALGATLWFALTGEAPVSSGHSLAEIREAKLRWQPPADELRSAGVPGPVAALLCSLLSVNPAGRPQTARELAAALAACKDSVTAVSTHVRHRKFAPFLAACGLLLLAVAAVAAVRLSQPPMAVDPALTPVYPGEKSIAVLPFDDPASDPGNVFFANGVQDEILRDLSRLANLKVISRNSVLRYRAPAERPMYREIGRALGVNYLLEGTVHRQAAQVHFFVRLVHAADGERVWSEAFDRDAADVISLPHQVANTVAGKLRVRLSGEEKTALGEPPTRDMAAYELYLHAKEIMYNFEPNTTKWEPLYEAVRLLNEATARDPEFFDAWVLLTTAHGNLLWFNADPTPVARAALGEKALATVRRLRPDAGETHLCAANYFYNLHQPERGRPELALARQKLPNDPRVLLTTGTTGMIDGRWAEALDAMEKAAVLDPCHPRTVNVLSIIYEDLRRYDDARRVVEKAIAAGLNPDYFAMRHAAIVQNQTGDTTEYHTIFQRLAGQGAPSERTLIVQWDIAMRDRDFNEALRVIAADPRQEFTARTHTVYPRGYLTGGVAYARGALDAARADYAAARPVFDEAIRRRPDDASAWMILADLDARLGRRDDALREGLQAVTLLPISRDASEGAKLAESLGWIYAATGDKARGLTYLESLENVPAACDYGFLNTHPDFDVFRGEPRFQAILAAIRAPVDPGKFRAADFPAPPRQ